MGFMDDIQRAKSTYDRLNAHEKDALKDIIDANPLNAFVLKDAKDEAEAWAKSLATFGGAGLPEADRPAARGASIHNGPADAARHCYWSALLASQLTYNEAMRVVFTHEFDAIDSGKAQDKLEARMDIHNDRIGLEIGTRMKGATKAQLQAACMDALTNGKLVVIDKRGSLVPTRSLQPHL